MVGRLADRAASAESLRRALRELHDVVEALPELPEHVRLALARARLELLE